MPWDWRWYEGCPIWRANGVFRSWRLAASRSAARLSDEDVDIGFVGDAEVRRRPGEGGLSLSECCDTSLGYDDFTVRLLEEQHLVARYEAQSATHLDRDSDLPIGGELCKVHGSSILEIYRILEGECTR